MTVGEQFTKWEDLVPGRRYKVTLGDCCIEGFFVSTFERIILDDEGQPKRAVFTDAEVEPRWSFGGAIDFEAVESSTRSV